jgi:hypothetical protein
LRASTTSDGTPKEAGVFVGLAILLLGIMWQVARAADDAERCAEQLGELRTLLSVIANLVDARRSVYDQAPS